MTLRGLTQSIQETRLFRRKREEPVLSTLTDAIRFPYGPFRFKAGLARGTSYTISASSALSNWNPIASGTAPIEGVEYVDSDASKFNHRFYRLTVGDCSSANVIGYASIMLPPGFSLVANPLIGPSKRVADLFGGWPDGTTLNKFDTRLFQLQENKVVGGKWTNPTETLHPGEGAIFYNPTSDYKSHTFVGEVNQGQISLPLPAGFSLRSSLVPQPGNLAEDLDFPVADGDVIHLFDRERQKYVLYPFRNGGWTAGAPVLGLGESFWVAKTEPGNWKTSVNIE